MTIRIHLNDGRITRTAIYRNVIKGRSYAQLVENFHSFKNDMRWGVLEQLKGKECLVLHTFGKLRNGETLTQRLAEEGVYNNE